MKLCCETNEKGTRWNILSGIQLEEFSDGEQVQSDEHMLYLLCNFLDIME